MTGAPFGRALAVIALAAAVVVAAGCGNTVATPPGEAVPALSAQLTKVDDALSAQRYTEARKALDGLIRRTITARDTGQITSDQANRILAAAALLAADLPVSRPTVSPTPSPSPTEGKGNKNKGHGNDRGKNKD